MIERQLPSSRRRGRRRRGLGRRSLLVSLAFLFVLRGCAAQSSSTTCSSISCATGFGTAARWATPAAGTAAFRRVSAEAAGAQPASTAPIDRVSAALASGVPYERSRASAFVAGWAQLVALDLAGFVDAGGGPALSFLYSACDGAGECTLRNGSVPLAAAAASGLPLIAATPLLDGEPVYGSTPQRAAALRTFSGGLLKEHEAGGPPLNSAGLAMGGPAAWAGRQRLTGSPEGNASPALLAVIGTLVREHNRAARTLRAANGDWDDEQLYQEARVRTVAMIQRVTYLEFLPLLMGSSVTPGYSGYKALAGCPSLEFGAAASLVSRTLLPHVYARLDAAGAEAAEGPLAALDGLYSAQYLLVGEGLPGLVRGAAATYASRADLSFPDYLRTGLWPLPDAASSDLARARALALPRYGPARAAFGLSVPAAWSEVADPPAQRAAEAAYPSPADADLLLGLFAEREAAGALVGPLTAAVFLDTFRCVRDADPYWYDTLPTAVRDWVRGRRFTQLVVEAWAPAIPRLPRSVFIATPARWLDADFGEGAIASKQDNGTAAAGSAQLNAVLTLEWRLLLASREIEVAISCACDGWVGMGLGESMADADVVWHRHNASGLPQVLDAKAYGFRPPATDAQQDVRLLEAARSPGQQRFRWRRAWETGDPQDKPFRPGPQRLIFAWRPSGTEFGIHNQQNTLRGELDFWAAAGVGSSSSSSSAGFVTVEGGYGNTNTVHAIAMGFAWGLLVPTSIFCVRYLKHHSFWIDFHRATMQLALTITIPAASAAFAARPASGEGKAHGFFGLALTLGSAMQLAVGYVVRHFHTARRPAWRAGYLRLWHRWQGRTIAVGALANAFLGMELLRPDARAAFIAWFVFLAACFAAGELAAGLSRWRVSGVHDSLNSKKVAHITAADFDRAVRLGSQWVLLGDRVFDVAPMVSTHPGGAALLHGVIGQDVSAFLFSGHRAGGLRGGLRSHAHSFHALRILQDLCVAVLQPEGAPAEEDDAAGGAVWTLLDRRVACPSRKPIVRCRFVSDSPVVYESELRYCGQHFEVTAAIGGREVHRHYSLVRLAPPSAAGEKGGGAATGEAEPGAQELWVRRYPNGAMSRYLLDCPIGAQIRVRGPLGLGLRLTEESGGQLAALVGGTGILPMLDLIAHLRRAALTASSPWPASPSSAELSPVLPVPHPPQLPPPLSEAGDSSRRVRRMSASTGGTQLGPPAAPADAVPVAWHTPRRSPSPRGRPGAESFYSLPLSRSDRAVNALDDVPPPPTSRPSIRLRRRHTQHRRYAGLSPGAQAREEAGGARRGLALRLAACFETVEDVPELAWLEECAASCPALELALFVKRPPSAEWVHGGPWRHTGRLDRPFLKERVLRGADKLEYCYIVGPTLFTHTMRSAALELGVDPSSIVTL